LPIRTDIDAENNLSVTRFTGVVTEAEFREYAARLRRGFDRTRNAIADLRSSDLKLATAAVRAIAEAMRPTSAGGDHRRVAIVVAGDTSYGLGRMFQSIQADAANVYVFREYDEAFRWVTGTTSPGDDDLR
ncbi:MAG: STAS/SEC14 domain-containing protein, partial [Gemmatimonadota bacterium]